MIFLVKDNSIDFIKIWRIMRIVLPIFAVFIGYYNIMLKKRNRVLNAISTIDIMLKKRNDLIPNLVNSVKGMMKHEKDVLEKLIDLRNSLNNVGSDESFKINNAISKYLNEIMVLSENYPNLKANQSFLNLQKNLRDVEEIISAARRTYNLHVTNYNTFISIFPNLLFAKLYHFKKYQLFKILEEDKKGKVSFNEDKE